MLYFTMTMTWSYHDHTMAVWISMIIPCHSMIVMFDHGCHPGNAKIWLANKIRDNKVRELLISLRDLIYLDSTMVEWKLDYGGHKLNQFFLKCSWMGRSGIQIHNSANNLNWLFNWLVLKTVFSVQAYRAITQGGQCKNNNLQLEWLQIAR